MKFRNRTASPTEPRSAFLVLLAILSILSFEFSHTLHHLQDADSHAVPEQGSHSWSHQILFHTGTLIESTFVVPPPPYILAETPGRRRAGPNPLRPPQPLPDPRASRRLSNPEAGF
jgi:hypothetical protein